MSKIPAQGKYKDREHFDDMAETLLFLSKDWNTGLYHYGSAGAWFELLCLLVTLTLCDLPQDGWHRDQVSRGDGGRG